MLSMTMVFLLLVPVVPSPGLQQDPKDLFALAFRLQQSGDLEGAIRAYQEFLRIHPQSLEARSNLGAIYSRKGDYGKAIEEYTRALEIDGQNAAVRFNLGVAFYRSARIPAAAGVLTEVVSAQPENKSAAVILADCHLQMGENKKVIALLTPFEPGAGSDRALLYLLGTALIRDNQMEKGQALVDRILGNGDSAEARLMLGTARMMGRDYRGALEEFGRAVELNDKLPGTHSYYGRALLAMGDRTRAMENFRREIDLNGNDFDSNLYMGVLLKQDQKFEEALNYFRRALQIRPGAPNARYQIATLNLSTGNLPEAQLILEELVKEAPEFVEAHTSLATVYYRSKRKADGDRHREIVRRLNTEAQARAPKPEHELDMPYRGEAGSVTPTTSQPGRQELDARAAGAVPETSETFDALAARASSTREANRIVEAIELYKRALELRPSWHEGWWYLGTLYYEADRYLESREAFTRLTALKPEGGVAWAMLGLSEFELRNYADALEHFQNARRLGIPANTRLSFVSRHYLALLLNKFGKPEAALQILYGLARKESEIPSILTAMGLCALALPYLPTELPSDKLPIVTKAGQAQFYMATRQMAEAGKASESLIDEYPGTPNVHYSYGVFLLVANPDAALEEFRRELLVSPAHVSARLQIAFEYIKRSEYGKALPYAEEAARLSPESFAARNALGRILLEQGEAARAIQELEIGLKLAPDSPEMHFALARAYTRAGRKQDAERERLEFRRLDRMRRTTQEGSQAVGGIEPPVEQGRPH